MTITRNTSSEEAPAGFFNAELSTANISNTLIAQNTDNKDCGGVFNSKGFNLIGNNSGCEGFGVNNDIVGNSTGLIDARLDTMLEDHGGLTETLALLSDSPAIDEGNSAVPGSAPACDSVDQRGVRRPIDGPDTDNIPTCDIGAFEFGPDKVNSLVTFQQMEPSPLGAPTPSCPGGIFRFAASLTNTTGKTLSKLVVEVIELTNGNLLENADGERGGVGARKAIPDLAPGVSMNVDFEICLRSKDPFRFSVDILGMAQ